MAAVTVCAAAIPDHVRVQVKQHDGRWRESARLWTVLVGLPSSKKSPIMNAAVGPLRNLDRDVFRDWQQRWAAWSALERDEKKTTPEPLQRRHRLGDTTVEAAQEVFRGTDHGLLIDADELTGWFGALDKYGGGKSASADRAFWLQAFNGGEYAFNRVGRGAALLPNLSASILGGIQPDAIRRIAGDAVDDGLLQRFIPIMVQPAEVGEDAAVPWEALLYDGIVRALAGVVCLDTLQFAPEAHEVRRDMEVRHHRLSAAESVNRKLGSHIGKLDGIFARLCVVWHVVENVWSAGGVPKTISGATAHRVAQFMREFMLPHAFAFYAAFGLSDDQDRLEAVAGYILAKRLSVIDHRTVYRSVRLVKGLKVWETRCLFETLQALNWVTPIHTDEKRNGEPEWHVNSYVHALFAERAQQEEARRLMAQAAIRMITEAT